MQFMKSMQLECTAMLVHLFICDIQLCMQPGCVLTASCMPLSFMCVSLELSGKLDVICNRVQNGAPEGFMQNFPESLSSLINRAR